MKRIINLTVLVAMAISVISCGNQTKKEEVKAEPVKSMQVDELMGKAESLIGKDVVVEGMCTHICSHGALKMFLKGEKNTLRIESGDLGAFKQECVNSNLEVKGVVEESRIDEEYLQKWERELEQEIAEKHGEDESGCATEKDARQEVGNSSEERIADFRKRIAERKAEEGKEYLSFYHIVAKSYEIK